MKQFYKMIAGISAVTMLLCTACAENPDSAIVKHKDMEKVIDEASRNDESKVDVVQLREYNSYTADFADDSLQVSVHADADVDIPQSDRLSVMRVKQHAFTNEDIAKFRAVFFGDAPLYDEIAAKVKTKADLEDEIEILRNAIQEIQAEHPDESDEYVKEYQQEIDRMQKEYEAAPEKIDRTAHPASGALEKVADRYAQAPDNEYLAWLSGLNSTGTVCYMSQADGNAAMYVQNDPDHSNALVFSKSPVGTEFVTVLGGGHILDTARQYSGMEDPLLDGGLTDSDIRFTPIPGDSAALSQADAQKQAEDFLHQVGMDDFAFSAGGKYNVRLDLRRSDGVEYTQNCYVLQYYRCFDGAMLDQASGGKFAEEWEGDSYRKQFWPGECVEFMINDTGIVGFCWNAPLDIVETVVDHAVMKPFEEVTGTFEQMMPIVAAVPPELGYDSETKIDIDRVTLTYSRISEKDSFDTGLVIPVWAFHGTRDNEQYREFGNFVQMAINAIDGTVINSDLGY